VPLLPGPTTPDWQRHQALPPARFRLFPFRSPLLRESRLLSFPQGTEMFQFPWFPLPALCVQAGVPRYDSWWVSPFGHPRINAREVTPRGLSQPPTSFIGFRRQGIHRWLFVAWRTKMLVLAMKFSRDDRPVAAVRRPTDRDERSAPWRRRRRGSRPPHRQWRRSDQDHATGECRPDVTPENGTEEPGHQLDRALEGSRTHKWCNLRERPGPLTPSS